MEMGSLLVSHSEDLQLACQTPIRTTRENRQRLANHDAASKHSEESSMRAAKLTKSSL